jgi:hypothetical protein
MLLNSVVVEFVIVRADIKLMGLEFVLLIFFLIFIIDLFDCFSMWYHIVDILNLLHLFDLVGINASDIGLIPLYDACKSRVLETFAK